MAAQELRWLTYLLTDLGEPPRSPPVLYVDNKAMLALCREQRLEHRTKHIALRYFLARELQQRGQLRLAYVASEANTADVFTKALAPSCSALLYLTGLATQRSSQGYTFSLGSGSVSWRATRSSSVLSSSCEAEIYARAMAAQELRWLTYLLTDLGEPPRSPPVLYVDNKAMLALCREQRLEHRTKHIALRYFLARELQQRGQLRLAYVASEANTADVFTKALAPSCSALLYLTGLATQRSSQGYTFSLGSGSVSWRATRSSSVLSSSCEAEIYARAMAAQELRWLTYLLTDLGEPPRSPPVLYVDNKAMLALCREQRLEHRTKHIALRYFLARELQQRGQLRLAYVASEANTADVFTKALAPCDHQHLCTQLGLLALLCFT
ncbi:unnamed protein product [Closterium sp. NIES-53]